MIISIVSEKALYKIQYPTHDKNSRITKDRRVLPQRDKKASTKTLISLHIQKLT